MSYQGYENFDSTVFKNDFTNSFAVHGKSEYHSLHLHVTQNVLQLSLSFFSFSFLSVFLVGLAKAFYVYFYVLLLETRVTSSGLILLGTIKKVPVMMFSSLFWNAMCFSLFTITRIHNIRKKEETKTQK